MPRTIKQQEHDEKRNQILDAAQHLVYAKGFARMTVGDILAEVQISSGAFYHYFDSKPAVLEAFVERLKHELETPLLPIIRDPHLSAVQKLQGFFDTLSRLRLAHQADVVALLRVWYSDDNAVVRQKVEQAVLQQRTPLLTEIISQGVREGSFTTADPAKTGEVVEALLQGMGHIQARLFLSSEHERDELRAEIVATQAAFMDAVERVLGAPANSFSRADAEAVNIWLAALRGNDHA